MTPLDPVRCTFCLVYSRLKPLIDRPDLGTRMLAFLEEAMERGDPLPEIFVSSYEYQAMLLGQPDPLKRVKKLLNQKFSYLVSGLRLETMSVKALLETMAKANSVDIDMPGYRQGTEPGTLGGTVYWIPGGAHRLVEEASSIAVVLDNAGEAVVDLAVAGELARRGYKVWLIARGEAFETDVTVGEVREMVTGNVEGLVSTGGRHPAFSPRASPEARRVLETVDAVISKGIANLEAFLDNPGGLEPKTLLLLRAKCGPVAQALGVERSAPVAARGDAVLRKADPPSFSGLKLKL